MAASNSDKVLRSLSIAIGLALTAQIGAPISARSAVAKQAGAIHRALIGPRLVRALGDSATSQKPIRIIVMLKRDDLEPPGASRRASIRTRQDRVMGAMPRGAFEMTYRYESVSGFAGYAPASVIENLRRHPEVRAIHLDYEVHATLAQGVALIGADTVHAGGMTGAGVTVAVIDTGIDTNHPDLVDDIVAERCFCDNHVSPAIGCCPMGGQQESGPGSAEDDNGHGTHTAGIITSGGVVAALGVAPDAGIVAIKALASNGGGFTSGIAAGFDWVVTNHAAFGIDVVNASLGDGGEYNDPLSSSCSGTASASAISMLHAAGISVFVASGNDGFDNGISAPACVAGAISVGGVYDASLGSVSWCGNADCTMTLCTDTSGPDVFVCHSNSDEILDVLAPDWATTSPELGGGATPFGGTSAASPYAAGQAALLLEADPTLLPEQIRSLLKTSGPLVTNADNGLSFARSDISVAIASLSVCGNGRIDFGEACDDGNVVDGDCCSSSCQFEPLGSSCDDGDACTGADQCDAVGSCSSAGTLDCDDANLCTDDSCDSAIGCLHVDNALACDDGDVCTTSDSCSNGVCSGGPALVCDDANPCTDDTCDSVLGCVVTNNAAACDDGNACTMGDGCSMGNCVPGPGLPCDDFDACTQDSCDPGIGCLFVTTSCEDNDPCTAESCDALTGCAHTPILGCPAPVSSGSSNSRKILFALILGSAVLLLRETVLGTGQRGA